MRILLTHDITIHKKAFSRTIEKARALFPFLDKLLFRLPQSVIDAMFGDVYAMNERVAEIPFLFMALSRLKRGARILDAGCNCSILSVKLATAGFKVHGIDVNDYPFHHPNLAFVKGSICSMEFGDGSFDAVAAVSTVEHIGLGHYGDSPGDSDLKAMAEMRRVLKKGGYMVLTVPYGKKGGTGWFRIYDGESLAGLTAGLETLETAYFLSHGEQYWTAVEPEELSSCGINKRRRNLGCACLLLRKP